MARSSTERLGGDYNLEPRGSAVSCTSLTRSQPAFHHRQVWYYDDLKGAVFFIDPVDCYTAIHYLNVFSLVDSSFVHTDSICVLTGA